MRRTLFLPQWWNSLGHTRLTRTTVEDRERWVKESARKKKEERVRTMTTVHPVPHNFLSFKEAMEAEEDIILVKHTRMPHGISRELPRMRVSIITRLKIV